MKYHWKEYFTFTKKERTGVIVLVVLITIVTVLPYIFKSSSPDKKSLEQLQKEVVRLSKASDSTTGYRNKYQRSSGYSSVEKEVPITLFEFDPNTLDAAGWRKLGVRERTIQTIQHYVAKGGQFRKPEDIGHIYGLRKEDIERLLPYVRIPEQPVETSPKEVNRFKEAKDFKNEERSTRYARPAPEIVEINTADTTAWIALPGIGNRLAQRITNFREKLGGFYSVEQVAETYALPDSTFQQIKSLLVCSSPVLRTININTADVNTLRQHPYIRWNLANAIVQYRQQHGLYQSVDDLQKITILTPADYQKIAPYLSVGQ